MHAHCCHQNKLLAQCKSKLVLAGDGCCDSSGSSAKYCTYTFVDTDTNLILHVQTVDKHEVGLESPNVEQKAFLHGMAFLIDNHLDVAKIVTDASSSVWKSLDTIKLHSAYVTGITYEYL